MRRVCQLTALRLLYASLVGLTGCATSAELESLRAEVAKANAIAVHAEARVSATQRELAVLKAALESPVTFSKRRTPPTAPSITRGGYKWGKVQPCCTAQ